MPLSRSDCAVLVRQIQNLLREHDPATVETVLHAYEHPEDPRRHLILLLQIIGKFYSERSGGQYAPLLDSVNRYVRLPDGSPVRGLSVSLTPADRELYGREEISLAALPDRSEFIEQINSLAGILETEINWREDQ